MKFKYYINESNIININKFKDKKNKEFKNVIAKISKYNEAINKAIHYWDTGLLELDEYLNVLQDSLNKLNILNKEYKKLRDK